MAEASAISWTRSTFNPWIGCTRVSLGCDHCYAAVSTPARSMAIKWGAGEPRRRTSLHNWNQPRRWNKLAPDTTFAGQKGFWPVFCSSLADVFDNEVPDEWRRDLWDLIEETPNLTWMLLTKRVGNVARMARTVDWLERKNVWLGITVVNQEEADRDIPKLLATPANKRWISYEPALGPVDWTKIMLAPSDKPERGKPPVTFNSLAGWYGGAGDGRSQLNWIIAGGESDQAGAKARPFHVAWARSTVEQCKAAGVACFVKQIGSAPRGWCSTLLNTDAEYRKECDADHCDHHEAGYQLRPCTDTVARCVYLVDRAGADPAEWPEDLRVQEFPL